MSRDSFPRATRAPRLAAGAAAVAALVGMLAAAGCGRHGGSVPSTFSPEGVGGQDNLLTVELTQKPDTVVRDTSGVPVDTLPGTPFVHIRIFDRTVASGYQLYRALGDSGYQPAVDYATPFRGTYNGGYGSYDAIDRDWQPMRAQRYLARGIVGGQVSALSPLTNTAVLPAGDLEGLRAAEIDLTCPIDTVKMDSLPVLVWRPIPGAARYLVKVWRSSDTRLFFLGLAPATGETHYQLGSGAGTVFQEKLLTRSLHRWTVEAIDAQWRVVGRSQEQLFLVVKGGEARPHCTP